MLVISLLIAEYFTPPQKDRLIYYYHYEATELGDLSNSKDLTENTISCVYTHCLIQSSWTDGEVGIMICILCVKVQRPKDIKELLQSSTDDKWKSWNQNLWSIELVPTFHVHLILLQFQIFLRESALSHTSFMESTTASTPSPIQPVLVLSTGPVILSNSIDYMSISSSSFFPPPHTH